MTIFPPSYFYTRQIKSTNFTAGTRMLPEHTVPYAHSGTRASFYTVKTAEYFNYKCIIAIKDSYWLRLRAGNFVFLSVHKAFDGRCGEQRVIRTALG